MIAIGFDEYSPSSIDIRVETTTIDREFVVVADIEPTANDR